jgi:hypothetical protein
MAKPQQKDLLAQFRDLGSEALNRLGDVPGGSRLMEMANETRTRLDEMQKRLRGLDELERRVAAQGATKATTARRAATSPKTTTPRKTTTASKATTPKKPPA